MNKAELLVKELAEMTGSDMELDASGICELVADGNLVVMRYREASDDWLCFGVVLDGGEEELSRETLAKALEIGLFGAETGGYHLGLHGNSLVLSDIVPFVEDLTAETFAERMLALSQKVTAISERLEGSESFVPGLDSDPIFSALDERLIRV